MANVEFDAPGTKAGLPADSAQNGEIWSGTDAETKPATTTANVTTTTTTTGDPAPVEIWEELGVTSSDWEASNRTAKNVLNTRPVLPLSEVDDPGWAIILRVYGSSSNQIDQEGLARAISDGAITVTQGEFQEGSPPTYSISVDLNGISDYSFTRAMFGYVENTLNHGDKVEFMSAWEFDIATDFIMNDKDALTETAYADLRAGFGDGAADADPEELGLSRGAVNSVFASNAIEFRDNTGKDNAGFFVNFHHDFPHVIIGGGEVYDKYTDIKAPYGFEAEISLETNNYAGEFINGGNLPLAVAKGTVVSEIAVRDDNFTAPSATPKEVTIATDYNISEFQETDPFLAHDNFEVNSEGQLVAAKQLVEGEYKVALSVIDNAGNVSVDVVTVIIKEPPTAAESESPEIDAALAEFHDLVGSATEIVYDFEDNQHYSVTDNNQLLINGKSPDGSEFALSIFLDTDANGVQSMYVEGWIFETDGSERKMFETLKFTGASDIQAATTDINDYMAEAPIGNENTHFMLDKVHINTLTGELIVTGGPGIQTVNSDVRFGGDDTYTVEFYDEDSDSWIPIANKTSEGASYGSGNFATLHKPDASSTWRLDDVSIRVKNDTNGTVQVLDEESSNVIVEELGDGRITFHYQDGGNADFADVRVTLSGSAGTAAGSRALAIDPDTEVVSRAPELPFDPDLILDINEAGIPNFYENLRVLANEDPNAKTLLNLFTAQEMGGLKWLEGDVDRELINKDIAVLLEDPAIQAVLSEAMDTATRATLGITTEEAATSLQTWFESDAVLEYRSNLGTKDLEAFNADVIAQISFFDVEIGMETINDIVTTTTVFELEAASFDDFTIDQQTDAIVTVFQAALGAGRSFIGLKPNPLSAWDSLSVSKVKMASTYYADFVSNGGGAGENSHDAAALDAHLITLGASDEMREALGAMHNNLNPTNIGIGGFRSLIVVILVADDFGAFGNETPTTWMSVLNTASDLINLAATTTSFFDKTAKYMGYHGFTEIQMSETQQYATAVSHIVGNNLSRGSSEVEKALVGVDTSDAAAVTAAIEASPEAQLEISKAYAYARGQDPAKAVVKADDSRLFLKNFVPNAASGTGAAAAADLRIATGAEEVAQTQFTAKSSAVDGLGLTRDGLVDEKTALQVAKADAQAELPGLRTAKTDTAEVQAAAEAEVATNTDALTASQEAIVVKLGEESDAKIDVADAEVDFEAADAAETSARNNVTAKQTSRDHAFSADGIAGVELAEAEVAKDKANAALTTLETSGTATPEELAAARNDVTAATAVFDEAVDVKKAAGLAFATADDVLESAKTALVTATAATATATEVLADAVDVLTTVEGDVTKLRTTLGTQRTTLVASEEALVTAETIATSASDALANKNTKIVGFNAELRTKTREITNLETEITTAGHELNAATTALDDAKVAVTAAQAEVNGLKEGIDANTYFDSMRFANGAEGTAVREAHKSYVNPDNAITVGTKLEAPAAAKARIYTAEIAAGSTVPVATAAAEAAYQEAAAAIGLKARNVAEAGGTTEVAALDLIESSAKDLALEHGFELAATTATNWSKFVKGAGVLGDVASIGWGVTALESAFENLAEENYGLGLAQTIRGLAAAGSGVTGLAVVIGAALGLAVSPVVAFTSAALTAVMSVMSIGETIYNEVQAAETREAQIDFLEDGVGTGNDYYGKDKFA